MSNTGTITVSLKLQDTGAVKVLNEVGAASTRAGEQGVQAFSNMDASTRSFSGSAGQTIATLTRAHAAVMAVTQAVSLMSRSMEAFTAPFAAFERQTLRLSAQIAGTGRASQTTGKAMEEMAQRIDAATLQSAAGARNAQAMLMSFRNVATSQMERILMVAADVAEVMGGDITTAARQMAIALEDPERGLTMLRRTGTTFTEAQKDMIVELQKAGKTLEAQTKVLEIMESQYGGTATAAAKGLAGALDLLSRNATNLKVVLGEQLAPVVTDLALKLASLLEAITRAFAAPTTLDQIARMQDRMSRLTAEADKYQQKLDSGTRLTDTYTKKLERTNAELAVLRDKESILRLSMAQEGAQNVARLSAALSVMGDTAETAGAKAEKSMADIARESLESLRAAQALADFFDTMDHVGEADRIAAETAAQFWRESHEKLYADRQKLAKYSADDLARIDRDLQDDRVRAAEAAQKKMSTMVEKALADQQREHERMVGRMTDYTADVFHDLMTGQVQGWEDMVGRMQSIFIRMLAEIAAQAAVTRIILPVGQMSGILGPASSVAGSAAGGGLGINPLSLLNPGRFLTTGIGNSIGTSLFGATAWGGPAAGNLAASLGIGKAGLIGQGAVGSGIGTGISGTLAAAAPFLAAAALIAVPLITKLLQDDPDPRVGFVFGKAPSFAGAGEDTSKKYDYYPWLQDIGNRPEMGTAVRSYFDNRFDAMGKALGVDMSTMVAGTSGKVVVNPDDYKDPQDMLRVLEQGVFSILRPQLLAAVPGLAGADPDLTGRFDDAFFQAIAQDGEMALDTFARFSHVIAESADFAARFATALEDFGDSAADAFRALDAIQGVFDALGEDLKAIRQTAGTEGLRQMMAVFEEHHRILTESKALDTERAAVQAQQNEVLGAMVTGLTAETTAQALWEAIAANSGAEGFVASLEARIREGAAHAMVNAFAEGLYSAFLAPVNEAMGALVQTVVTTGVLTTATVAEAMGKVRTALNLMTTILNDPEMKALVTQFAAEAASLAPSVSRYSPAAAYAPPPAAAGSAATDTAGVSELKSLVQAVKTIRFSDDQLTLQGIARDMAVVAGSLSGAMTEFAAQLAQIQALDIYKFQAASVGDMKARIYGLEAEWQALAAGAKYGVQLETAAQQQQFVAEMLGMSATQFITHVSALGISVDEAAGDMVALAGSVTEARKAFADVADTLAAARQDLAAEDGALTPQRTATRRMADFERVLAQALSDDWDVSRTAAGQLPGYAGEALASARSTTTDYYEYQGVRSRVLSGVEQARILAASRGFDDTDTGQSQLQELRKIAADIRAMNELSAGILTDATFAAHAEDFNEKFDAGGAWDTLTSSLIDLPALFAAALPDDLSLVVDTTSMDPGVATFLSDLAQMVSLYGWDNEFTLGFIYDAPDGVTLQDILSIMSGADAAIIAKVETVYEVKSSQLIDQATFVALASGAGVDAQIAAALFVQYAGTNQLLSSKEFAALVQGSATGKLLAGLHTHYVYGASIPGMTQATFVKFAEGYGVSADMAIDLWTQYAGSDGFLDKTEMQALLSGAGLDSTVTASVLAQFDAASTLPLADLQQLLYAQTLPSNLIAKITADVTVYIKDGTAPAPAPIVISDINPGPQPVMPPPAPVVHPAPPSAQYTPPPSWSDLSSNILSKYGLDGWDAGYAPVLSSYTAKDLSDIAQATGQSYSAVYNDLETLRGIHGFASGGYYPGGLALVGEEGPEFINFSKGGTVHTTGQSRDIFSAALSPVAQTLAAMRSDTLSLRQDMALVMNKIKKWDRDGAPVRSADEAPLEVRVTS